MQPVHCPICKSKIVNEVVETYQKYTLYWCTACDLQWWHPMEDPGVSFYEETCCVSRDAFSFADELGWDHRQFFRYLPKTGGRLLDIGCRTGHFLYEVKRRRPALQAVGLDFDKEAVEVAKDYYRLSEAYAMSLEEFCAQNPMGGFDIVTSFQVLEHQWDPVSFLGRVRELLVPGGYVVLGVPNRNTWGAPLCWDYPPMHFTRWSVQALRLFLQKYGFSVVLIHEPPISFSQTRALISFKINFLGRLEGAAVSGFKKTVSENRGLNGHPVLERMARRGFGVLRLFRKGILFTPTLFLCAAGRAASKKGQQLFCIAKKE